MRGFAYSATDRPHLTTAASVWARPWWQRMALRVPDSTRSRRVFRRLRSRDVAPGRSARQRVEPANLLESREVGVGRAHREPMLDGQGGKRGVADEIAAQLIPGDELAEYRGVMLGRVGIQAMSQASQSSTCCQACAGVSGCSDARGLVLIRTNATRLGQANATRRTPVSCAVSQPSARSWNGLRVSTAYRRMLASTSISARRAPRGSRWPRRRCARRCGGRGRRSAGEMSTADLPRKPARIQIVHRLAETDPAPAPQLLDRLGHIRIEDDGRPHGAIVASRLLLQVIEMRPVIEAAHRRVIAGLDGRHRPARARLEHQLVVAPHPRRLRIAADPVVRRPRRARGRPISRRPPGARQQPIRSDDHADRIYRASYAPR